MARWLGEPLAELPVAEAQASLARRWLARFGPAAETDLRWWTGWTLRDTRAALAAAGTAVVDVEGIGPAFALADDLQATPDPGPWVALLPALDPTTMGWKARDWYLGPHRAALFDTAGNAGPTIWCDGRIVGGWAVMPSGDVLTRLLEDIGSDASAAVSGEAERLTAWLQTTQVVPRFATPLARQLVSEASTPAGGS
jgi:hypothetical protein